MKKLCSTSTELRYQRLFETTRLGILILDCKTRKITDTNPFFAKLTGYPVSFLIGKKISELDLFEDKITGKQIFSDLDTKEEVFYEDIVLIAKNKTRKIVEVNAHAYEEDGGPMVQCTVRDLTEKRKAQSDLFETNQRLEALMNALPVGIAFSLDPKCEHIEVNPYLQKKMEMSPDAFITSTAKETLIMGHKYRHFRKGRELKPQELPMQLAIKEKKVVGPFENEVELPSGKRWLFEAFAAPIRDTQGKVVGAIAVHTDLTERRRAEAAEKLEQQIAQEKLRMTFIADAAHELRTPLAIIKGNVDLALHTKTSPTDALNAINTEVVHLTNLLSDMALLTTKESELQRKVGSHKLELGSLIAGVVKRHETFAHEKHIKLHLGTIPSVTIAGDEYYLERLFSNIISNAVAYGKDPGDVWVEGTKDATSISIFIRDNGVGISTEDLPHIFERFYRAESSRSKDFGGSGLGLTIVKWITDAHRGTVTATSRLGEGSTFTVRFPRA